MDKCIIFCLTAARLAQLDKRGAAKREAKRETNHRPRLTALTLINSVRRKRTHSLFVKRRGRGSRCGGLSLMAGGGGGGRRGEGLFGPK